MEELIKFLKANGATPELIAQAESLKTVNLDTVKEFLTNDNNGKLFLQSHTDAVVTKGIETFKTKTMPNLIEEEIKKKFPDETAEQKQIRQLSDNQTRLETELKRKDLLNKAIQIATEKKLPLKLVEKFLGEDEETTIKNLGLLETEYSAAIQSAVQAKFSEEGRGTPPPNTPPAPGFDKMTDEQYFAQALTKK